MFSPETTVRDIVVRVPESTRLFEKLAIDYCCGGNRMLKDACDLAGLQTTDVLRMLGQVGDSQPVSAHDLEFQRLPLTKMIDHIVDKHHVYTKNEILRLQALSRKVFSVHGGNHPELHQVCELFDQLGAELMPHMFKEEHVLFPYITELVQAQDEESVPPVAPFVTVNNPIRRMMLEHDMAGEILRELRRVTANYKTPSDACISFRTLYDALEALEKDLHQHIHLENNILFPRSAELEALLSHASMDVLA